MRNPFKEAKYAYQRATRGWCDRDCWNINSYLCEVLPAMLRHLASNNTGCPSNYWEEGIENPCRRWELELLRAAKNIERIDDLHYGEPYWEPVDADVADQKFNKEKWEKDMEKFKKSWKWLGDSMMSMWD